MKVCPFPVKRLLVLLLLAFLASCDQSTTKQFTVADIPDPKKTDGGYVSNPDHLLSDAAVSSLNEQLGTLDRAGKVQVGIVVVHSIGQNDTRDFVHQLFNYWKIGSKEKNNGLLILMVEDARKLEFETGTGIEADMPDIICFRIQQEYMIPRIKEHDYDAAFRDGILSVAALFNNGNYAYDQLPEPPVVDSSLVVADAAVAGPVNADYPGLTAAADSAVAGNTAAEDPGLVEAPPSYFADNTPSVSSSYIGEPSLPGLIFWFIASLVMIRVFFSRKIKARKGEDNAPVRLKDAPNELLRPGTLGFILVYGLGLLGVGYMASVRHTDVGFLKTFVIFYLAWCLFMSGVVIILLLRAAAVLHEKDRHEKWACLAMVKRDVGPAAYAFPLPLLGLYVWALKKRMDRLRNEVYECPKCNHPMHRLNDVEDNDYLDKAQVVEEHLESVDYDIWRCDSCSTQLVLNYTNMRSTCSECPSCHHYTFRCDKTVTLKRATTSSQGMGSQQFSCAACKFKHDYMFIIPKVSSSSSGSSSSGSSFSSSSSSSSSWGGGSSGGGGASSSW
ncbi:hypothetical protein HGH91_29365 [Chitinophaga eiseniae]|uniref:TPM domain-containing protein n=2 Tax=Chitinophaga eiseniae TaxID=634771 RepID=A0A847SLE4_9BACT|nr:hypothetical protein [Chitinophaga eiseniae]